jgi:Predicted exporters of the RND superfamily
LSRKIEQIPGVEDVESLANAIRTKVFKDYTEVNPYLAELPKTEEDATEIRDAIVKNPLYKGYLVSADGTGLMISVRFKRDLTAQELIKKVSLINQYSEQSASGVEQFLSGPLFVRLEISRLLLEDLYRVMPLAVLVTLAVLAFGFRNLRGVFLPFLSNTLALGLTFSIFILNGNLLNYVTVILPPTIYVVGFAYSVHVMSDFERYNHSQIAVLEAVKKALDDVFMPRLFERI